MIRIGDSKIRSLRLEFNWKEDKLGTIIDILRVGCVMFLLFLFASLVFGCEDRTEAEVSEPNDYILFNSNEDDYAIGKILPTSYTDIGCTYNGETLTLNIVDNEIVSNQPAEKTVEIIFKSLYNCYVNDGIDVNDLTVRFEGLSEPNEPECSHERLYGTSRGFNDDSIYCATCGEAIKILEPEPNEPELTYTAEELDEIYKDEPSLGRLVKDLYGVGEGRLLWKKDLHKIIPTWPDYIELDKELMIKLPERPNLFQGAFRKEQYRFPKGTKIYFKDDD